MPRHPRLVIPGATYHDCCRVARGEFVFDDPHEAGDFVEKAREIRDADGWRILAWCLMGNHYMVVRTSSVPFWRGMHGIQNRFSCGFKSRFGRTGSLWQGRYKANDVEDQSYLDRLVLYVHLNPVMAGLVDDPVEYPFVGHREAKREIRTPFVDVDEMLLAQGRSDSVVGRPSWLPVNTTIRVRLWGSRPGCHATGR